MLSLNVTIQGDRVVVHGLRDFAEKGLPQAAQRGLIRSIRGIHRYAYDFLSGPGRSQMKPVIRNSTLKDLDRPNLRGQSDSLSARPGAYPVPVITGNLRRQLDFVEPGQTRSHGSDSFTAGPLEAIEFDSALYGRVIHDGGGSSAKYGPRRYIVDALARFNSDGGGIAGAIEDEVGKEIQTRGLA